MNILPWIYNNTSSEYYYKTINNIYNLIQFYYYYVNIYKEIEIFMLINNKYIIKDNINYISILKKYIGFYGLFKFTSINYEYYLYWLNQNINKNLFDENTIEIKTLSLKIFNHYKFFNKLFFHYYNNLKYICIRNKTTFNNIIKLINLNQRKILCEKYLNSNIINCYDDIKLYNDKLNTIENNLVNSYDKYKKYKNDIINNILNDKNIIKIYSIKNNIKKYTLDNIINSPIIVNNNEDL